MALAVGCGPSYALPHVPVVGGTPEQIAEVYDELEDFSRWIGPDRVELREIRFVDGPLDVGRGTYPRAGRRVVLTKDLIGAALRNTLRHELCHAVDYQEGLLASREPLFDALVDRLTARGESLHVNPRASQRLLRSELLARICVTGPAGTRLLQSSCPGEPDELDEAAARVEDWVWRGVDPLPLTETPPPVEHTAPFDVAGVHIVASEDGRSGRLGIDGPKGWVVSWVDLASGDPDPDTVDPPSLYELSKPFMVPPPEPLPPGLHPPPAPDLFHPPYLSVAQSDRAALVVRPATSLGVQRRVVVLDAGTWHGVDACPGPVASVFSTPDRLWLVWAEGSLIQWTPISSD